jgi:hypothetical protein
MGAWLLAAALYLPAAFAADPQTLSAEALSQRLETFTEEQPDAEKLRRAQDWVRGSLFSSLQVKAIAERFRDENARLQFAIAAYPRTVDPENYYEVYDAFYSFSKVMRLHDAIKGTRAPAPEQAPGLLTPDELQKMVASLRGEPFEEPRLNLARQMVRGHSKRIASEQLTALLNCFAFESNKVELAKYAYAYVADPERYYLINKAFNLSSSRQEVSEYIEEISKPQKKTVKPEAER